MPRAKLTNIAPARAIRAVSSQASSAATSAPPVSENPESVPDVPRVSKTRARKAERDELKDISMSFREVKTYRGGFTRPTALRSSNWQTGGAYVDKRKVYESPDPDAYTPRTVYLLEGRHPTVHGHGRVDAYEHSIGVCKEGTFPNLVQAANSATASRDLVEPMDNARWPWDSPRRRKRVRWWEEGENPQTIRQKALQGPVAEDESPRVSSQPKSRTSRATVELLTAGVSSGSVHARAFHTSSAVLRPDDPNSSEARKNIPASTWSRPPRPSQDARDDVVPTYYVERKKQRDDISQRKEEEGSLMAELNAGILSEGLAAKTRVRDEKIPVEVRLPDGSVAHPSGFTPPTPETEFHPVAAKVPTEDHPLVATIKQPWDERDFPVVGADPISHDPEKEQEWIKRVVSNGGTVLTGVRDLGAEKPVSAPSSSTSASDRSKITTSAWDSPAQSQKSDDPDSVVPPFYIERKKQRDDVAERKEEEGGLMAELNAGILSEDLAAQTREREEKIPVEVILEDGTIVHPSGFVPPTPETEFHPLAAKPPDSPKLPWTEIDSVKEVAPDVVANTAKKPSNARGFHTSAVARASVLSQPLSSVLPRAMGENSIDLDNDVPHHSKQEVLSARRAKYAQTLEKEPFWRPLITVTTATRPLAATVLGMARGLERGQAFYTAIDESERKDFATYNARMRNLQLNRIQHITHELARRLGGAHGGFVGLRTNAHERGRGVRGEGLADPLPRETRVVKIGVGEWYPYAEEVKERFLADAERGEYADLVEVFGVDEWGNRTDGKAWAGAQRAKDARIESLREGEAELADRLDVD
ncbi:hypothetical protein C8Q79DRAFT_989563 [Trametes meyenii]|nr:hypothetical protein C8Q79DRAFT_989563 [Trametes meyenii]